MRIKETRSFIDYSECSPFGMLLTGRNWESGGQYRYGFNGKENDDETYGNNNAIDFGARVYDARLGRWMSVDGFSAKYPFLSGYNFCQNSPLWCKEINGYIFDYSNLSEADAASLKAYIELMKSENVYFKVYCEKLETSNNVFKFISDSNLGYYGNFVSNSEGGGGTITLQSMDFTTVDENSLGIGLREEFFHAFQYEYYGREKYDKIGGSNMEFEPRFLEMFYFYSGYSTNGSFTPPGQEELEKFVLSLDPKTTEFTSEQLNGYLHSLDSFISVWSEINRESNGDNPYDDPKTKDGPGAALEVLKTIQEEANNGTLIPKVDPPIKDKSDNN